MPSEGWESAFTHLEVLVEGARGLRDFSKVCDLKSALAVRIRWLEARCFLLRLLTPELLLLEDELVLGEGVEKHPERSIGSGELQVDDSVEEFLSAKLRFCDDGAIFLF